MNLICFWNRTKDEKNYDNLYKHPTNNFKCTICNCKPTNCKIATIWKQEYIFCSQDCWTKWANSFN
jgi:hypothetical protein